MWKRKKITRMRLMKVGKNSVERLQMVATGCNKACQIQNGLRYLAQSNENAKKNIIQGEDTHY